MKKNPIGFITRKAEREVPAPIHRSEVQPKKSVVRIYFPHRGTGWAYYNDSFDLKVGDFVYVEGKLEGYRGQVTEVNHSFKIKLSDYKRVVAVADTNVTGDFYLAGTHIVSFDRNAIPYSKVLTWFKAPENGEDFVCCNDGSSRFPLDDLSKMKISPDTADRGHDYYVENRIVYAELDGTRGHAIAEGSKYYEIEFDFRSGEISNLKCSCFCSGACKHEFAVMLQLRETLDLIAENYDDKYSGYFAAVSKDSFVNTVMSKRTSGRISLEK